jgi:hypothetical protein
MAGGDEFAELSQYASAQQMPLRWETDERPDHEL